MKLLLLGGLFDAIFVLYSSNSEDKKPNTRHFTSVVNGQVLLLTLILTFLIIYALLIIIILIWNENKIIFHKWLIKILEI